MKNVRMHDIFCVIAEGLAWFMVLPAIAMVLDIWTSGDLDGFLSSFAAATLFYKKIIIYFWPIILLLIIFYVISIFGSIIKERKINSDIINLHLAAIVVLFSFWFANACIYSIALSLNRI